MVAVGTGQASVFGLGACQHLASPARLPRIPAALSVLSYNVLLPNSQDGWWTYKMFLPPLGPEEDHISSWDYRKSLLRERIGLIDADVVCVQEVSPLSFEQDFAFMTDDLGYDGVELFRKGRFRPATFWKTDRVQLASPAMHKDRTLLTSFRLVDEGTTDTTKKDEYWHVLNCHLQAGKQGGRRVRQINEGVSTAFKTAKNKIKEKDPENLKLIACGDFNGGRECGAVQLLEKGSIGPDFLEDGEQVSSKEKVLPIPPMIDAVSIGRDRASPPATLVVPELISIMIDQGNAETAYINPEFSKEVLDRLRRIYDRYATVPVSDELSDQSQMGKLDVERWLTAINLRVGRGTEFRNAARFMGWVEPPSLESEDSGGESKKVDKSDRPPIFIPDDGILTYDDFVGVYLDELRQGKFWGIAWDLSTLGEPLLVNDVFQARYDRMYCSSSLMPVAVLDTTSDVACPNKSEPSDHLPVCASFIQKQKE
ncbi:hypothetical protein ACHAXR_009884 [Thalassiosira sp. AJA248-18]